MCWCYDFIKPTEFSRLIRILNQPGMVNGDTTGSKEDHWPLSFSSCHNQICASIASRVFIAIPISSVSVPFFEVFYIFFILSLFSLSSLPCQTLIILSLILFISPVWSFSFVLYIFFASRSLMSSLPHNETAIALSELVLYMIVFGWFMLDYVLAERLKLAIKWRRNSSSISRRRMGERRGWPHFYCRFRLYVCGCMFQCQ